MSGRRLVGWVVRYEWLTTVVDGYVRGPTWKGSRTGITSLPDAWRVAAILRANTEVRHVRVMRVYRRRRPT